MLLHVCPISFPSNLSVFFVVIFNYLYNFLNDVRSSCILYMKALLVLLYKGLYMKFLCPILALLVHDSDPGQMISSA